MNRAQHDAAREPNNRSTSIVSRLGVRSKRDLASDKNKSFNEKFSDFVRAHPSEREGLAAYEALPD
jgi:hypothetical protein